MCLSLHAPYCMVLKFVGAETKKAPAIGYFRIASAKVRQVFIGALGAYLLRTYEKGTPTRGMP